MFRAYFTQNNLLTSNQQISSGPTLRTPTPAPRTPTPGLIIENEGADGAPVEGGRAVTPAPSLGGGGGQTTPAPF